MKVSRRFFYWLVMAAGGLVTVVAPGQAMAQRALGIDVSGYQGSYQKPATHITWTSLPSTITFAWTRATDGVSIIDPDFAYNVAHAKAAGIPIGAYHYAVPSANTPAAEAAAFWNQAGATIKADGLTIMPMLDMESLTTATGASSLADWANQWCNAIKTKAAAAGVNITPCIYISACHGGQLNTTVAQWLCNIADYNGQSAQTSTPWTTCTADEVFGSSVWTAWQYTSTGGYAGITGNVDHDVFNGTVAQMKAKLLATVLIPYAPAGGTVFWDPGAKHATPGSGGSGNWDGSTVDWWYSGTSDSVWSTNGNNAVFAGTGGTVNLNAARKAGSLTFNTGGYTIAGTASVLTLTSPATISVSPLGGSPVTVNCILAGSGYTVTGGGVLALNNTANSSASPLTINTNTTLVIPRSSAIGAGTGTVTLRGGGILQNNDATIGDTFLSSTFAIVLGTGGGVLNVNTNSSLAYGGIISGSGTLTKIGGGGGTGGTLILTGANTYTGNTTISQGVLALGATGSISHSSSINIASGAAFDVSAISGWTLGVALQASGAALPATIYGGTNVSFGAQPIVLNYGGTNAPLSIAQGVLVLSNNAFTVNSSVPLAAGDYILVQQAAGNIIDESGAYPTPTGTAIGAGTAAAITVCGSNVVLNLQTITPQPSTTTVSSSTGGVSTYGMPVSFTATVSGSDDGGTVSFYADGSITPLPGSSAISLSGGMATTPLISILSGGVHTISAVYGGDAISATSTGILTGGQTVNPANQTINFPSLTNQTYGVPPYSLTATASSGLTVSFAVASGPATISSNTLTIVGSGAVSVSANQTGDSNYFPALSVTNSFTVALPSNTIPVAITGLAVLGNGTVRMNFMGTPGYIYLIEAATNLSPGFPWVILSTNNADTNGAFSFIDQNATNYPGRYYRTATP